MIDPEPDVLVVGGGTAGVAAAVAAGRSGASVVLVERYGFLGGMATAAMVGTVCGLYLRGEGATPTPAHGGLPAAFGARLAAASATAPIRWRDGLWFLPYDPIAFRVLCDDLLAEAGVAVRHHAWVTGVERDGAHLGTVTVWAWDRSVALRPRTVVDATGTAAVCGLAGVPTLPPEPRQAPAQVFVVTGVPEVPDDVLRLGLLRDVRRAVRAGRLPPEAEALSVVPGTHVRGRAWMKLGLPGWLGDGEDIGALEVRARRLVREIGAWLAAEAEGFDRAEVVDVAPQLGVRTGSRPRGRVVLTDADVLGCRKRADGVALGAWPIERWGDDPRPELTCFAEGDGYHVPAGALVAEGLDGLYLAGRLVSATEGAIASARVIGTCLATGYAAGTLAAWRASGRPEEDAVAAARDALLLS